MTLRLAMTSSLPELFVGERETVGQFWWWQWSRWFRWFGGQRLLLRCLPGGLLSKLPGFSPSPYLGVGQRLPPLHPASRPCPHPLVYSPKSALFPNHPPPPSSPTPC